MLTKANENITELINEIIMHRSNNHRAYCCGFAGREDNNYYCSGDRDVPKDSIELRCSECKSLYWREVQKDMINEYIVR